MKLDEYLIRNGVKLFINPLTPKGEPRQTNSLGAFDYAENLDNILGKHVWICDYRVNDKAVLKPIRDVKPMEVVIADANNCKKNIYYSPVYFQPVKGKKVLSTIPATVAAPAFLLISLTLGKNVLSTIGSRFDRQTRFMRKRKLASSKSSTLACRFSMILSHRSKMSRRAITW